MKSAALVVAGIMLLGLGLPRAAHAQCALPIDDIGEASDCLFLETKFFDDARDDIVDNSLSFVDVLPPSYEVAGKYSESTVDAVIAFLAAAARDDHSDQLLYEASFRKASAHGMFGDDALMRGLDPGVDDFDPAFWVTEALKRLDSRTCHTTPSTSTGDPCISVGDCRIPGQDLCLAGDQGPYGAVQEYRRAEGALLYAIQLLGRDRFRQLDESAAPCLGSGCAARLLVRLGAMKARAQAEHAQQLWRRGAAASGVSLDAPLCTQGDVGTVCSIHRDCDSGGVAGVCGGIAPAEAAGVLVRGAVREALAEASAAESFYEELLSDASLAGSSDLTQRNTALQELLQVESRSENGLNPFGIPDDYVPLLTGPQQQSLQCLANCGTNCDQASASTCMIALAAGTEFFDVLAQAETAMASAVAHANQFADAARNTANHEFKMEADYRESLLGMLGDPCAPGECSCTEQEQDGGFCVAFSGDVWLIEGVECDDSANACGTSESLAPDGEMERQLLAVRSEELGRQQTLLATQQNEEDWEAAKLKFAAIGAIDEQACLDNVAAISRSGSSLSNAIDKREKALEPTIIEEIFAMTDGAQGGAGAGGEYSKTKEKPNGNGYARIIGAFVGGARGIFGFEQQQKRKEALVRFEKATRRIQTQKELVVVRIRCRQAQQIAEIELDDTLRQIVADGDQLALAFERQSLAVVEALAGLQRLGVELRRARERLAEARDFDDVWSDVAFRNPANYRALALKEQLEGAAAFRTAQIVTWMLLRAVAYDLARPDGSLPQTFGNDRISLGSCDVYECSGNPSIKCKSQDECSGYGSCVPAGPTQVQDSTGSCSLQAVFAARTVDDLRALIRGAVVQLTSTSRTIACPGGSCEKRIHLRNLFADASLGENQPPLGEVLVDLSAITGKAAVFEFGVTLDREYDICAKLQLADTFEVCQPGGVAPLSGDAVPFESGPGDDATNLWNARLLGVKAVMTYVDGRAPGDLACRNLVDGSTVNSSPLACIDGTGTPVPPFTACTHANPSTGTGCTAPESQGGGEVPCQCFALMTSAPRPELTLRQRGPGIVRTRSAARLDSPSGPFDGDQWLRFTMRSGDLPIDNPHPELGAFYVPKMSPFAALDIDVYETENTAVEDINIAGVPAASSRWEIDMTQLFLDESHYSEVFVSSIEDIELIFRYQAFVVPP